jgi:hypothetical protein
MNRQEANRLEPISGLACLGKIRKNAVLSVGQARITKNWRLIKAAFQDAWAISDSKVTFINALEERGFKTARGNRRGFVAVDCHGEIYAFAKWTGVKTKQVRSRLGDENNLPGVEDVKKRLPKKCSPLCTCSATSWMLKDRNAKRSLKNGGKNSSPANAPNAKA